MWNPDDDDDDDVSEESGEDTDNNNQGEQDYKECGGQAKSNPIDELFHPSYDPPKDADGKDHYDAGWDNAHKQDYGPGGGAGK